MSDIVGAETRSRMMRSVPSKNTSPERTVRRGLHARGFRFRLHRRSLPGSPDIVLPKYRAAVFVHGCFWHRHEGCSKASMPGSRTEFWSAKFSANVARDQRNREALLASGWRVAVVWECSIKREPEKSLDALGSWLKNGTQACEV